MDCPDGANPGNRHLSLLFCVSRRWTTEPIQDIRVPEYIRLMKNEQKANHYFSF